jgi:hypothetical protein
MTGESHAEEDRDREVRAEGDRPPGAPRRSGRVGERADVLVRDARTAGASVGTTATAIAAPIAIPIVERSSVGAPGAPTRLAPGFVRSGAASGPITRPNAADVAQREEQWSRGRALRRRPSRGAALGGLVEMV